MGCCLDCSISDAPSPDKATMPDDVEVRHAGCPTWRPRGKGKLDCGVFLRELLEGTQKLKVQMAPGGDLVVLFLSVKSRAEPRRVGRAVLVE